jgi:hypothetical protein
MNVRVLMAVCLLCAAPLTSCTTRSVMLDAPLVSMTDGPKEKGAYSIGRDVSVRYCMGEDALSTKESPVGMIDEVVFRAQKEADSKYIAQVTIQEVKEFFSNPCYELQGKAAN